MTTYYAMTAEDQLAAAQRVLDLHVTSSATGRCLACGSMGPCYKRETAVVIFSRSLRRLSRFLRQVVQGFVERACSSSWSGLLIHTVVGRAAGSGCLRTN